MVQIHVRKGKKRHEVHVFCVSAVLAGTQIMPKNWRRGSVECMDEETIREALEYFRGQGQHYGPMVKVVPEKAVRDAEAGEITEFVNLKYPCLIMETGETFDPQPNGYIQRVIEQQQRLKAQTAKV